jgi:hypothetical protein
LHEKSVACEEDFLPRFSKQIHHPIEVWLSLVVSRRAAAGGRKRRDGEAQKQGAAAEITELWRRPCFKCVRPSGARAKGERFIPLFL